MKNTYKQNRIVKSSMKSGNITEGMTMETKVALWLKNSNEDEEVKPLIYNERKEGIQRGHDIRTDRFDVAIEAMDKSSKSIQAKRESKMEIVKEGDGKPDSVQGTDNE